MKLGDQSTWQLVTLHIQLRSRRRWILVLSWPPSSIFIHSKTPAHEIGLPTFRVVFPSQWNISRTTHKVAPRCISPTPSWTICCLQYCQGEPDGLRVLFPVLTWCGSLERKAWLSRYELSNVLYYEWVHGPYSRQQGFVKAESPEMLSVHRLFQKRLSKSQSMHISILQFSSSFTFCSCKLCVSGM